MFLLLPFIHMCVHRSIVENAHLHYSVLCASYWCTCLVCEDRRYILLLKIYHIFPTVNTDVYKMVTTILQLFLWKIKWSKTKWKKKSLHHLSVVLFEVHERGSNVKSEKKNVLFLFSSRCLKEDDSITKETNYWKYLIKTIILPYSTFLCSFSASFNVFLWTKCIWLFSYILK